MLQMVYGHLEVTLFEINWNRSCLVSARDPSYNSRGYYEVSWELGDIRMRRSCQCVNKTKQKHNDGNYGEYVSDSQNKRFTD